MHKNVSALKLRYLYILQMHYSTMIPWKDITSIIHAYPAFRWTYLMFRLCQCEMGIPVHILHSMCLTWAPSVLSGPVRMRWAATGTDRERFDMAHLLQTLHTPQWIFPSFLLSIYIPHFFHVFGTSLLLRVFLHPSSVLQSLGIPFISLG